MRAVFAGIERGLPPRRYVVAFLAFLAVVAAFERAFVWFVNWRVGEWLDPEFAQGFQSQGVYNIVLLIGLAGLAGWRAAAFNPALDGAYRTWLLTTPWTADKPLPMGSHHLRWQDAALVALAACGWTLPPETAPRVAVVMAFALPYSGYMAAALWATGQLWSVCGAAALSFALLLTIGRPEWQAAAVAAGLCVYCDWAFRRALRQFPWEDAQGWFNRDLRRDLPYHWPRLRDGGVVANEPVIPWRWAGALSVLGGWAAATIVELCTLSSAAQQRPEDFASGMWTALWVFCFLLSLGRWAGYVGDRSAPLGLWARLRLRRWIIAGHDYVYLAPLAVLAIGAALPWALFRLGASAPLTAFITVTGAMLIALGAPPTLAKWSLTGEYRTQIRRQGLRSEWVQAG
jgi:hypothetical protein